MTVVLRYLLRRAERRPDPALTRLHEELLDGVRGVVVEVGCGRGRLFPRYPSAVDRLVAVEPDPASREAARAAAAEVGFDVQVVDGDAEALPLDDASADVVVFSEVLCSVARPDRVLAEARRVLRPSGELRAFEHVAAQGVPGRLAQRLVDVAGWPRLLGGCHTSRDTTAAVERAGFTWSALRRPWQTSMLLTSPSGPHILGTARPSADPSARPR
jgi:SAM-dependent methyltransferase